MSAYIGFCPPVAMNACPLTAIRPLSVIGKRMFASAAYRHIQDGGIEVSAERHGAVAHDRNAGLNSSPTQLPPCAA